MRRLIYTWLALNSRYLRPLIIGFIVYLYCSLLYFYLVYQGIVETTDKHFYIYVNTMVNRMEENKYSVLAYIIIGVLVLLYVWFGKKILARYHPRFLRVVRFFCYAALDIAILAFLYSVIQS